MREELPELEALRVEHEQLSRARDQHLEDKRQLRTDVMSVPATAGLILSLFIALAPEEAKRASFLYLAGALVFVCIVIISLWIRISLGGGSGSPRWARLEPGDSASKLLDDINAQLRSDLEWERKTLELHRLQRRFLWLYPLLGLEVIVLVAVTLAIPYIT
jgi:hypothetical protein